MKRMLILILIITCIWVVSGCGSENAAANTSMPTSNINEKKWAEEDIANMFSQVKDTDWEFRDCVLISDHASSRVGALLFWDKKEQTSNVAFFHADGYYQRCGIYAKIAADPDFKYLGDGSVTFKAESEDGTIYNYTITILIDGDNVNFKVEDDFIKKQ